MKQVVIKFKAFKEMIKFFSKYSSNKIPKQKWVESMGFLFCNVEGDFYIIEDAVGMASGSELDVNLSPMKFGNIDQLEREHEGFIGGWWHTHPDLCLFFSETDVKNQLFYQQSNEDGLGIVFDHAMINKEFLGFKLFRLIHKFSTDYIEVEYQLQEFAAAGIKEALIPLGLNSDIVEALSKKYGGKGVGLKIDFSKIGEPIVDDALNDSDWIVMEANGLLKENKIVEAIKKYKMVETILKNTQYIEKYTEVLTTLIKLCAKHNYLENAKEEFKLFETIKAKLGEDKFYAIQNELNPLINAK